MKTLPVILIGLMACLAIGVSTARGQISYSLEDLGVVKEMEYSEAVAINNQGNVAGTAYKGLETCAFHYSYKFMLDAGGLNSRGFGINSTNLVVGDAFTVVPMEPRSHAAMFKGGVAVDLGFCQARCTAEPMASTHWARWLDSPVYSAIASRAEPSCGAVKPA